jgi:RNA polymerase sigma-70 factor (ECF subfamily)
VDVVIDHQQFLTLLTSHQRRLVGYVRALVPNRTDAEEVLQEVNLYVCQHEDEFQAGTNFAAWVLKVAHFCVLKWRDRRVRERIVFDDALIERLAVAAKSFETQEDRRQSALDACLEKLEPLDRKLVTEFYGELGATPQSLADQIGRSVNGLYVSVYRLRIRLFDCIRRTLAAEDHIQ